MSTRPTAGSSAGASGQTVRWLLCIAVLLAVFVLTFVSSRGDRLQVCPDGPSLPCRPMHLDDAPIVVALIIAAVLLLPDLRRLNIGGLVELERVVKETQTEVLETRRDVAALKVAVDAKASASSETHIDNYIVNVDSVQDEDLESLKARARQARVIK